MIIGLFASLDYGGMNPNGVSESEAGASWDYGSEINGGTRMSLG